MYNSICSLATTVAIVVAVVPTIAHPFHGAVLRDWVLPSPSPFPFSYAMESERWQDDNGEDLLLDDDNDVDCWLTSPHLFSPRSSFSPLQKSASSSRFLRIHPSRRRSIHLNGDDGEGHTGERQSMTPLESQASVTPTSTTLTTTDILAPPEEIICLQKENEQLRESLRQMEIENGRLLHDAPSRIILETFEGERKIRRAESMIEGGVSMDDDSSMWCNALEDDACLVEPMISFSEALRDRTYWLVGLLILQSGSGIILKMRRCWPIIPLVSFLPLVPSQSIQPTQRVNSKIVPVEAKEGDKVDRLIP
jgi:hypothetical protein